MALVNPAFASVLDVVPLDPAALATVDEKRLIRASLEPARAVPSPARPLVMVLDDLRWAAATPLAFVDALLTDTELTGLLLVGAYRDREVDAVHLLTAKLALWGGSASSRHIAPREPASWRADDTAPGLAGVDPLTDRPPRHGVDRLTDPGVDVRSDLRRGPGGQHERPQRQRVERRGFDRGDHRYRRGAFHRPTWPGADHIAHHATAAVCMCGTEVNSRPRQNESRTLRIGRVIGRLIVIARWSPLPHGLR